MSAVPCITSFRTPWDFPDREEELKERVKNALAKMDVNYLMDVIDFCGSGHVLFVLLAGMMTGENTEQAVKDSIAEDVERFERHLMNEGSRQ